MNIRTLKKHLPKTVQVTGSRKAVRFHGAGLDYSVDRKANWQDKELADFMRSKMPVASVVLPQPAP